MSEGSREARGILRGIEQRLDAENETKSASSLEVVRLRARLHTDELVLEPVAYVLARQRVQWQLAAAELPQLRYGQAGNHKPVRNSIPLVTALEGQRAPNLKIVVLDADHAFSDKRVALTRAVLSWLETLKGR